MEQTVEAMVVIVIGVTTLVLWAMWWWNDIRYVLPVTLRFSSTGKKLPPGCMGLPVFGELLTFLWYFKFLRRPDEFINSKRQKFGDGVGLYRSHLFGKPSIIVWTPQANKFGLQSDDEDFYQEWVCPEIMGKHSLVVVHGEAHDRIRTLLMKVINKPDSLRHIALMIQPRVISSLHLWSQKGRITVYDEVKKVTLANIGKYFAGFEPGPRLDAISKYFQDILFGVRASPINIPGTAHYRALQSRKKLMAIFAEELEHRKRNGVKTIIRNDLMEWLMQMRDEQGKPLRDIEVLDNIVTLLLGGYESTINGIMWAFYFLAKNPNVLNQLHEEHMKIASQKQNDDFITYDDILTCKYTSKVVEETLRLANISPTVFRTANRDVEYKGYTIPKGWKAICWIRYLHSNPENFDDPMCFNPDRWNEPPKPGTYLVFGRGPRLCPGNMLARLQLIVILHHLITGYRWELVNPGAKMNYLPLPKPEDGVEIDICKM